MKKPAHVARLEARAKAKVWADWWSSKIPPEDIATIMGAFRSSLDTVVSGKHPGPAEWRDLADVSNVVETMMRIGMATGEDIEALVNEANARVGDAAKRYAATGVMRLDGPGVQAVRALLIVFEDMLQLVTRGEFKALRERTAAEIRKDVEQRGQDGAREVVML